VQREARVISDKRGGGACSSSPNKEKGEGFRFFLLSSEGEGIERGSEKKCLCLTHGKRPLERFCLLKEFRGARDLPKKIGGGKRAASSLSRKKGENRRGSLRTAWGKRG